MEWRIIESTSTSSGDFFHRTVTLDELTIDQQITIYRVTFEEWRNGKQTESESKAFTSASAACDYYKARR